MGRLPSLLLPAVLRAGPAAVALAAFALVACTPAVPEVQRLERYEDLLRRPLVQRVLPADAAVIERAHRTNLDYGEDIRPRAAAADHPLVPVVRQVAAELPPPVRELAERYLTAIYLVEEDFGSAATEGVADAQGYWGHAYMVLNLTALERDANAWATWKERSAFRPSPGYDLRMTIEPPASDDRAGAVRFIVLHELGHVLGLGLDVHGYWDEPAGGAPRQTRPSPFAAISWEPEEPGSDGMRSRTAGVLPALNEVGFYAFAEAPHTLAEAPGIYRDLERTEFPSLYGTLNVYDDWAEAFAIYVHVVLLGKPYRVELLRDGAVVHTYRSCIGSGACSAKIAQVRWLLDNGDPRAPRIRGNVGGAAGFSRTRR